MMPLGILEPFGRLLIAASARIHPAGVDFVAHACPPLSIENWINRLPGLHSLTRELSFWLCGTKLDCSAINSYDTRQEFEPELAVALGTLTLTLAIRSKPGGRGKNITKMLRFPRRAPKDEFLFAKANRPRFLHSETERFEKMIDDDEILLLHLLNNDSGKRKRTKRVKMKNKCDV
ncbi:hypothetical protein Tco_0769681 [Tanacetum coccineum]|uniref:Uncharacterized protein n=1 Tax=Tanacetum coccineum TaxID=301880 RepID=A0ABQ4ZAE2_9ASTR